MDDVADAVGLNKATVYHYYASKSLILYDIYKSAADFTVDALHDDPTATARETIYHFTRRLLVGIASDIERAAVYFQEGPYITEWFTEEQVAYIRKAETTVYEHVRDVIDRGIASGEFYDCDSHVLALGYIGMTLGSYRWLRPQGRRTAQEIAVEFSTALLRGLIKDEAVRGGCRSGSTWPQAKPTIASADLFRLDGKVAVVTGGGRGIGVMIARGLLAAGRQRLPVEPQGSRTGRGRQLEWPSAAVEAIPADLGTADGVDALDVGAGRRARTRSTRCSTTRARPGVPVRRLPGSGFDKVFDVNVKGVFLLTRALVPLLNAAAHKTTRRG